MANDKIPALYIVGTPIGNLEDITLRAVSVLNMADAILAEDTRVTARLLERYNIRTPLISYHQHSGLRKTETIVAMLREGKRLALVSDAGTPGINDPGGLLIKHLLNVFPELKVIPVPGANAAVAALSVSGFPADSFVYMGFPPHKKGRQTFFKELGQIPRTVVFYESKYRIRKALSELKEFAAIGERPVLVARELTKQFETLYRGTVDQISRELSLHEPLGEFAVVVGPAVKKHSEE